MAGARTGFAVAVSLAISLTGCLTITNDWANEELTPAQRDLRAEAAHFRGTVITGTAAGTFLGCALSAAIVGILTRDGDAAREACLGGGAVGAVVGTGAGYYIAKRNENYATLEEAGRARLKSARQEADQLARTADAARRVADENAVALADLEARYRRQAVTAERYRAIVGTMRADADAMRAASTGARAVATGIEKDAAPHAAVREQSERAARSSKEIDDALSRLEVELARVPS